MTVLAGVTATGASSDELTVYGGVDFVSNYVSSGVTQSDGKPAIQPFLEMEKDGFYAGTWMSNVDFGDNDDWEIDLYLGYRRLFASKLFLDFGYARYLYDDSGDCCGELKLTAAYPILPNLGLKGYVAYNPQSENWNRRVTLAYEVNEQLGFAGTYGFSDFVGAEYWEVGGSYAFNDYWSVNLRYSGSGSAVGDEGLVLGLSLATDQTTLARFLLTPFR